MTPRNILVTGGGTGIGAAVAEHFAADGAAVLIVGRRAEPLRATAARLGRAVRYHTGDLTDPVQVAALVPALPSTVDVVVHAAGGNTDFDRVAPEDLAALAAAWRANLDANLVSAVLVTAAVRDRLADGGAVISVGSIAADNGAGSYGAAKAAVGAWNVELAAELGPAGVTANVVSPGYIADTEFFRDRLTDTRRDQLIAATHTGRAGAPADIAAVVGFLASAGARHLTGQVIAVNGGARTTR